MPITGNRYSIVLLIAACWPAMLQAQTLWQENAESGLAYVIDQTDSEYPLIQSDVVGEGNYAFHLANPGFQDNSFVIDQSISIASDTKLFFLSRLRSATPTQIARVQLSNDGGNTWPYSIYNQPGSGSTTGGEGAFTLKEIDLGSYTSQDVRFRFIFDFTGGSAFTQTVNAVGWFVDDIQIGSDYEKLPWSIGNPSPHAQLYLEYINRARADALVEATRLANESDPEIQQAYNFFNIDGEDIVDQFAWYIDNSHIDRYAQPLSFQPQLLQAAELHTQDMHAKQFQGHVSSNDPPAPFQPGYTLGQRLDAVGYSGGAGENVFSSSESVAYGHAGFDVDWGNLNSPGATGYNPDFVGQGMQNPAGHRRNLHNGDFKEIGIGVVNGPAGTYGPQYVTQDLGNSGEIRYVTGVVFEDLNGNSFYDLNEGRSGVRIDIDGSPYYCLSTDSGGFSVPVPADGTYDVVFSGGGFQTYSTTASIVDGMNVKVDYLVVDEPLLPGDLNHDNIVDAADYTVWRDGLGSLYTLEDYSDWKANFGQSAGSGSADSQAAVPEPTASLVVLLGTAIITTCGRNSGGRRSAWL